MEMRNKPRKLKRHVSKKNRAKVKKEEDVHAELPVVVARLNAGSQVPEVPADQQVVVVPANLFINRSEGNNNVLS